MRWFAAISAILLSSLAYAGSNGTLMETRAVYIMPMANSLDQYLAQRLVRDGHFEVVTDPQRADAVFTDSLGEGFEHKMDELYVPKDSDKQSDDSNSKQVRVGGFSRGRGVVFLVDRTSRSVIWSTYDPDWRAGRRDMDARARKIADRLRKDVDRAKKDASKTPAPAKPAPDAAAPNS